MVHGWNAETSPRLVLGTVQLGMPYGIGNSIGKPNEAEACRIVEAAIANGIRHFDTAQAYGDSERILGAAFRRLGVGKSVFVTTKLAATLDAKNGAQVRASVCQSQEYLGVDRLWCVMLHDPSWLAEWDAGLCETLQTERANGAIEHLGVSLRTPDDAPRALHHRDIAIIQAPCNAWDRRMAECGYLEDAKRNGKLCCVRSVYLQGLLAMPPESVRQRLPIAHEASLRWRDIACELGFSTKELAMRYALSLSAPIVVGVESVKQIEETVHLSALEPLPDDVISRIAAAVDPIVNEAIIEPNRWKGL